MSHSVNGAEKWTQRKKQPANKGGKGEYDMNEDKKKDEKKGNELTDEQLDQVSGGISLINSGQDEPSLPAYF